MKDLKDAKVGDLMFDIEANVTTEVVAVSTNRILISDIGEANTALYDLQGRLANGEGRVGGRTLFYKGQITENEYLGLSADGVKMFYGMPAFSFHLASKSRDITEFIVRDSNKLKQHTVYSAAYSTKESAEKAQKKHFEPETFPLPWWLTVLSFDYPSIRIGSLPFRFSIYNNGWAKIPTDYADIIPACFVKVQFSELKNGDFFNLGADLNSILLKVHEGYYVRITNEGEVRNQNLGKLSEVFKVVASEVGKERQKVEIGSLSVGEKFSFEFDGDYNEIIRKESDSTLFKDPYGSTFEINDPSEMVYKI